MAKQKKDLKETVINFSIYLYFYFILTFLLSTLLITSMFASNEPIMIWVIIYFGLLSFGLFCIYHYNLLKRWAAKNFIGVFSSRILIYVLSTINYFQKMITDSFLDIIGLILILLNLKAFKKKSVEK